MTHKFTIRGTLPGLNDFIWANRSSKFQGASMKKQNESVVMHAARSLGNLQIEKRVYFIYHWYEPNRRRDKDNISAFGRKVVQDALVKAGILRNDGWNEIEGFEDRFEVDKQNPRIVVEMIEVE